MHGGHVFGTSFRRGWVCQEFSTGDIAWYQRANKSVGDGSLIFADGHLYLFGEKTAEVSLIEASAEEWVEKGRFALPDTSKLIASNERARRSPSSGPAFPFSVPPYISIWPSKQQPAELVRPLRVSTRFRDAKCREIASTQT